MKASDLMTRDVVTIRRSATVTEAMQLMQERGWRSLIVERSNSHDEYGIITETDILYKVVALAKDASRLRVADIMTKPCMAVSPDMTAKQVAQFLAKHGLIRVLVVEHDLLGIISASDILTKSHLLTVSPSINAEEALQEAIQDAHILCSKAGEQSESCAIAWEAVEEMQSKASPRSAKIAR